MCGIFAIVGSTIPGRAIAQVLRVLRHRGPDGEGLFVDEGDEVTLAHTRLAVIDLETGAQPLYSEDGQVILICNGEIYDFERIRRSLQERGHSFKTKCDSEVVLVLYQEFGLDFVDHLRGEFAFILYDRSKRSLIAVRDRFGIKPLYFARTIAGFVFASEMKAIFASEAIAPRLNVTALDPLLDQDPDNVRFPFEDVEHVPPGSCLVMDLDTRECRIRRYWSAEIPAASAQPVPKTSIAASANAAQLVLEHLEEAVRLRLRADVPVGLYLSGGVDSAFVGALMARNLNSRFHSFSISFEGSERDERVFARQAADYLETSHHELMVTKSMLWDNLEDCLWYSELPFVSLAPVGKFLLSKEARKHVSVVLTGEGADEVFLGYRSYFQKAIDETRGTSVHHIRSSQARRLKFGGILGLLAMEVSLLLVHKRHREQLRSARSKQALRSSSTIPIINAVQEARLAAMPLDILCYLGDREEMAHSLEARVPFLDHHLYDAAKVIPVDFKLRNGVEKSVLREAAEGILPDAIRMRRKAGFMLTSEAVDFFGSDRQATRPFWVYLTKATFDRVGVFSYPVFLVAVLLARVPTLKWIPTLRRLRRSSNKVLMYVLQTHMLHDMFVTNPRWHRA